MLGRISRIGRPPLRQIHVTAVLIWLSLPDPVATPITPLPH
jgi:hypothetical protein